MNSDALKAGYRPRGSAPAKWIPSRMTTNLSRRWPPGSGNERTSTGPGPSSSSIGRQLTGYGGSALVIESNVKATGYISEQMNKNVNRQLTGFGGGPIAEHVVESSRPRATSLGLKRAPNFNTSSSSPSPIPENHAVSPKTGSMSMPTPKSNGVTPHASSMSTPKSNGVTPKSTGHSSNGISSGASTPKVNGMSAPAAPTAAPAPSSSHEMMKKEEEPPSHSSSYKFVYLNLRARGEVSRLLFAAAGQDYENVLFDAPMDFNLADFWSAREQSPESFPYGQLPILEVDGQIIAQSHAIERFLADRFGLLGKPGSVERAQIDAVVEHCTDVFNKFISHVFSPNKDELIVKHYNEYFPQKCDYLEAILKRNGTGWMVGNSMSLADISVYQNVLMTGVPDYVRQSLEGFNPLLLALGEKVESSPGISRWLQERPDTFL